MRSFEERRGEFDSRGIRLVAISVDPPQVSRQHCRKQGYTYAFLSDPRAEVIRRYGLLHAGGGSKGADISRPAEFLVDSGGTIRWVNLTEAINVRARPGQVLEAMDGMGLAAPSK